MRGLPHLIEYMPESKDARRLVPDPENELDFYAISSKYPLPDDPNFDMTSPLEEGEKSTKSHAVTSSHLTSEASWFKDQMPPAKRPALMSYTDALKGAEAFPAHRVNMMAASAAAAPAPFGLVNSTPGASWLNDQMSSGKATPRTSYLHDIMGYIASAEAPSPAKKAPVPVAAAAPVTRREHFGAPDLSADALSHFQEVINRNNRNNQFLAVAALNANLGGLQQQQQQQQQQQAQNSAGNLGHILAGLQQSQPQPPLVQQGSARTHSELLAAFLRSNGAAPSYGS
jgi:hypothetical protein